MQMIRRSRYGIVFLLHLYLIFSLETSETIGNYSADAKSNLIANRLSNNSDSFNSRKAHFSFELLSVAEMINLIDWVIHTRHIQYFRDESLIAMLAVCESYSSTQRLLPHISVYVLNELK